MRFVIRWTSPGPAKGSYFRRMTGIGPEFGASLAEAHVFDTGEDALATTGSHRTGFTCSEIEPLDEAAYAVTKDAVAAPQIKQQYLGVLGLLAECSVYMGETSDAYEMRRLIEDALDDAQKVVPNLHWKRILNRFEVKTL